jgi:isochorismate synthase
LIPNSQNIFKTIQEIFNQKKPFVWFKKPDENLLTSIIQRNSEVYFSEKMTENGFVFCPFDTTQKGILIPHNQSDRLEFELEKKEFDLPHFNDFNPTEHGKDFHLNLVQKAIDFINTGKAKKIVISRKQKFDFNSQHVVSLFEKLLFQYPEAFVYLWYHPTVGLWMGATPEKLVALENDSFSTMALAGTQIFHENIVWQEKEKLEQQFVTEFIKNNLLPYSDSLNFSETFTKKAGHLAHLCTTISGKLKIEFTLQNLIEQLHPTPAVCGTPREVAKSFILENEGYNREFYTGYLGEINYLKQSSLFVNLRCMKIEENRVQLFVGGGITAESIPEKEWEETVNKSKILSRFLS